MIGGVVHQKVFETENDIFLISIIQLNEYNLLAFQSYSIKNKRFSSIEPKFRNEKAKYFKNRLLRYRDSDFIIPLKSELNLFEKYIKSLFENILKIKKYSSITIEKWREKFIESGIEPIIREPFIAQNTDYKRMLQSFDLENLISNWNIKIRKKQIKILFTLEGSKRALVIQWLFDYSSNEIICSLFQEAIRKSYPDLILYSIDLLNKYSHYSKILIYYTGTNRLAFLYLFKIEPNNTYFKPFKDILKEYNKNFSFLLDQLYLEESFLQNFGFPENINFLKLELLFLLFKSANFNQKLDLISKYRVLENDFFFRKQLIRYFEDFRDPLLILIACFEPDYGFKTFQFGFWTRICLKKMYYLSKNDLKKYSEIKTLLLTFILSNYHLGEFQDEIDQTLQKNYFLQILYLFGLKVKPLTHFYYYNVYKNKIHGSLAPINELNKNFILESMKKGFPYWDIYPQYILILYNKMKTSQLIKRKNPFNLFFFQLLEFFIENEANFHQLLQNQKIKTIIRWYFDFEIENLIPILADFCKTKATDTTFKKILNFLKKMNYFSNLVLIETVISNRPRMFFSRNKKSSTLQILKLILNSITKNDDQNVFFNVIDDLPEDFWKSDDKNLLESYLEHPNKGISAYFLAIYLEMYNIIPDSNKIEIMIKSEYHSVLSRLFNLCIKNKPLLTENQKVLEILLESNLPRFQDLGLEIYNNPDISVNVKIDIIKVFLNKPETKYHTLFMNDLQKIFNNKPTEDIIKLLSEHPNRKIQSDIINYFYSSLFKLAKTDFNFVLFYCRTILFTPRLLTQAKEMCFTLLKELYLTSPYYQNPIRNLLVEKTRSNTWREKEKALLILAEVS